MSSQFETFIITYYIKVIKLISHYLCATHSGPYFSAIRILFRGLHALLRILVT